MERMSKPDYMSDEEYKDLEEMKDKVIQCKIDAFDYMHSMLRYNETDFKHSGHKDLASALEYIIKVRSKETDKLISNHIKKYPDKQLINLVHINKGDKMNKWPICKVHGGYFPPTIPSEKATEICKECQSKS